MDGFGKRLREVRIYRGITQEEIAEMADITRNMIGRYETTDQLPSLDTLVRIADALGVSTDYLLGRTKAMDSPFIGNYVQPTKLPNKMPKNIEDLEKLIRTITKDEIEKMSQ